MKPTRVLFAALAVSVLSGSAAHADTFNFSFGSSASTFSGTGTMTGDLVSPGEYLITAISGTTDTGNGVNRQIAGLEAPGSFEGNDNLLSLIDGTALFDSSGLSYDLANGAQINLFSAATLNSDAEILERSSGNFTYQFEPITVTAATPEPGSLMLLGTGLLGVVGAARRRFQA